MNESVNLEAVRNEALRKLGRNILNFSQIEAAFKELLSISQLKVTGKNLSDQSLEQLDRNQTRLQKQTLGDLAQEYNQKILRNASQSEPTPDLSETEISLSYSVKVIYSDPVFLKEQKRKLASIVAERNKLIHQDLGFLDTSSVEDYHNLITLLDEQNPRLLAQLEELKCIIEPMRGFLKAFKDRSKSLDFILGE
ncbi:Genome sequencing data, contig C284 (plasmid) [Planktothrix agardhii]|jgi:hypothetical protein|uniref:Genome sequencing data, contig C284 n=1 Tax=Planktothrix agardhii TaxID=1160 RepID=A0A1J1JM39_PLAAG|nr:hypothetical protein [Planktothrix agardhii]MBG0747594.1 hypothetical protein [Planktothrix agardhii KL2]MCF3578634.1 hypothetical protein [Planktothrix agardhii 1812]MCF3583436.1 hypothetical protein [Planktothrix agardhii 1811]MCF3627492.1 hypothetical protein [Planktothrix agardhii 1801]CAD5983333.1 Genome sequencing data, contig C284 [Planktothrix agardhii]